MVFVDISGTSLTAPEFAAKLGERDILIGVESPHSLRAVTHLDVTAAEIATTIEAVEKIVGS